MPLDEQEDLSLLEQCIFNTVQKLKYRFYIKDQTQRQLTKQLLTSISVDIRAYQLSNVRLSVSANITLSGK